MGQYDQPIRILVVDSDPAFRKELASMARIGVHIAFADAPADGYDVVVIGVENPAALEMIATFKARRSAPVIAIAGAGYAGKSPEHVLLLAELRGAALTLPRPVTADELAMHATKLANAAWPKARATNHASTGPAEKASAARHR